MKTDTEKLRRISTYAREKGLTAQAIYKWIAQKKLKTANIDGITFIVMDEKAVNAGASKQERP